MRSFAIIDYLHDSSLVKAKSETIMTKKQNEAGYINSFLDSGHYKYLID